MSIDHNLLQICKERKRFYQIRRLINDKAVDGHTLTILNAYDQFFKMESECEHVPLEDGFATWFFQSRPQLTDEARAILKAVFKKAAQDPSDFAKRTIIKQLLQADLAVKTTEIMDRYHAGEDIDPAAELDAVHKHYCAALEAGEKKFDFVELDEELFQEDQDNSGLIPRWACLQNFMRPWRGGDFIIFASRPDAGKTSAIADNITYMAPQVAAMNEQVHIDWQQNVVSDPDLPAPKPRIILWLNNEGPGKRILKRVVQSAFGIPMSEIVSKQKAGTLWGEYEAIVGGDKLIIKVKDIHLWSASQVEELIKATNPALVVYDMIDNIQFNQGAGNGGTRTDQLLEAMYAWGRNMAVIYDHVGLATSQTSADAAELSYPLMHMLKDSKTGKQGACDAIIMMGIKEAGSEERARWISTPKNKLSVEGMGKSPREQMIFEYATSRFIGESDVNHPSEPA